MTHPILIVEDEIKLAELLRDYLLHAGFAVVMLHRGDQVLPWLAQHQARLLLLDLMLPGLDGVSICQALRRHSHLPIIMVTARVEEIDRLLGLELGADDYICKPFSPREVCARVATVLRRAEALSSAPANALQLDENKLEVRVGDRSLSLTAVEFRLLAILARHPGQVFSRDQLMDGIYVDQRIVSHRTIDSHIKKLRKRLDALPLEENPIHSVYGVGYRLD